MTLDPAVLANSLALCLHFHDQCSATLPIDDVPSLGLPIEVPGAFDSSVRMEENDLLGLGPIPPPPLGAARNGIANGGLSRSHQ